MKFVECVGGRYDGSQYRFPQLPKILKIVRNGEKREVWQHPIEETAEYYEQHVKLTEGKWQYKVVSEDDLKRDKKIG